MDILDEYIKLTEAGKWEEALPLIEHILSINQNISTSWFNYGVCLDALERHNEASQAFLRAYEIDQENYHAQYRVFRSMALADDEAGFTEFLSEEIIEFPEIAELLTEEELFARMLSKPSVIKLIEEASDTKQ